MIQFKRLDKKKKKKRMNRKRKLEGELSGRVKKYHHVSNDLYMDNIWSLIFNYLFHDEPRQFNLLWKNLRCVCKKWKDLLSLEKLGPFDDQNLKRAVFMMAVRCNNSQCVEKLLKSGIDAQMNECSSMRTAMYYDSDAVFDVLADHMNAYNSEFLKLAINSGADKILWKMVTKKDFDVVSQHHNVLGILLDRNKYELLTRIIRFYASDKTRPQYNSLRIALSDPDFMVRAYANGCIRLITEIKRKIFERPIFNEKDNIFMNLNQAIIHGQFETVKYILDNYPKHITISSTYITGAVTNGYIDIVMLILDYSKIGDEFPTLLDAALYASCSNDKIDMTKMLLGYKEAKINERIIHDVIKEDRNQILEVILTCKKSLPVKDAILIAAKYNHIPMLKKILDHRPDNMDYNLLLSQLCETNALDLESSLELVIEILLVSYNADPNVHDCLSNAINSRNLKIIVILLQSNRISSKSLENAISKAFVITYDDCMKESSSIIKETIIREMINSSIPLEKPTLARFFVKAVEHKYFMLSAKILSILWTNDETIPEHWKIFCLMFFIVSERAWPNYLYPCDVKNAFLTHLAN